MFNVDAYNLILAARSGSREYRKLVVERLLTTRRGLRDADPTDPVVLQVQSTLRRATEDLGQGRRDAAQKGFDFASQTADTLSTDNYALVADQIALLRSQLSGDAPVEGGGFSTTDLTAPGGVFRNDQNFRARQDANAAQTRAQFDAQHSTDGQPCTTAAGTPGVLYGGICAPPEIAFGCDKLPGALQSLCGFFANLGRYARWGLGLGLVGIGIWGASRLAKGRR